MEVDLTLPLELVLRELNKIILWRGKSQVISGDNGPRYISAGLMKWVLDWGIKLEYIHPGYPQQNTFVERFKRAL